jgi:twitching motility protein PilT
MKTGQRIGDKLVAAGVVTHEQLAQASAFQKEVGGTLGEVLTKLGFVGHDDLLKALAAQMNLGWVNLANVEIPKEILASLPLETVQEHRVLPISREGRELVLGMIDPTNFQAISEIQFQSGAVVRPVIMATAQFEQALDVFTAKGYATGPLALPAEVCLDAKVDGDITSLLRLLVNWKGQDLHLSAGAIPAIRIDNEMKRLTLPPVSAAALEELLAPLLTPQRSRDFAERLELDFAYPLEGVGRFRCNLYRQRGALAFTARYVSDRIPAAAELGLPDYLHEYALRPQGLILVTGPNGHGKSTTLAHVIEHINRSRKANIVTIEDPIEYTFRHKLSNVNQREVGTDTHSFAEGLKHIFRQNPDVIVIGELRDRESFEIAISAAGTGHLVLATMHSLSATAAIDRVIDMFPGEQQNQVRAQIAESLLLVLSQRLVRRARGAGRVLAIEKLASSIRIKNAIREGKVHQMRGLMQSRGEEFESIDESLAGLVVSGKVRVEEAMKWADNANYLADLVRQRGAKAGG